MLKNISFRIVIPFFNSERYIEKCIESIQTDINHEIIIIDNHSKDNSIEDAQKKLNRENQSLNLFKSLNVFLYL